MPFFVMKVFSECIDDRSCFLIDNNISSTLMFKSSYLPNELEVNLV